MRAARRVRRSISIRDRQRPYRLIHSLDQNTRLFDKAAGQWPRRRLSDQEARVDGESSMRTVDAAKAMSYRNLASSWAKARPATKATMVQSLYEEIVVRGSES